MTYAELILPEYDLEMANTRRVLERIPEDKWDWRAHPKSNTIGWNANHIAEAAGWVEGTLNQLSWDYAPIGGEPYRSPTLTTLKEILDLFDRNVAAGRKALAAVKDNEMTRTWSLLEGGKTILSMPRTMIIRTFVINHIVHHRAHVCVYLRLNNIPVPSMYGPSGDEVS